MGTRRDVSICKAGAILTHQEVSQRALELRLAAFQSSSISFIYKARQRSPNLATSYTVYFRVSETKTTHNRKDVITRNTFELSHTPAPPVLRASPFALLRQNFHIPSYSYGPTGSELCAAPVPKSLKTHASSLFCSALLFPGTKLDTKACRHSWNITATLSHAEPKPKFSDPRETQLQAFRL